MTFRTGALPETPPTTPAGAPRCGAAATAWAYFGQIHPLVAQNYGVDAEFYCAELSFDELEHVKGADPEYVPLPKFPAVTRDIAVVCDEAVTVGALEDCIRRGAKGLLKEVALFDIYTGAGIPEGKKSVAFSLTLRADDRSLTAEEADEDVKSILETAGEGVGCRPAVRTRPSASSLRAAETARQRVQAFCPAKPWARQNSLLPGLFDRLGAPRETQVSCGSGG